MIEVSSTRRERNAKQAVAAKGRTFQKFTRITTDRIIPPQIMIKSRTLQNHSFTLALRFSG
jgi:hypothetical protein